MPSDTLVELRRIVAQGLVHRRELPKHLRAALAGQPQGRIERGARLGGPGRCVLGRGAIVRTGVRAYIGPHARLSLGAHASLGDRCIVNCVTGITIGDRTQISWNVQLLDTDFHPIRHPDGRLSDPAAPIFIGSDVLIGTGSIILKGVTIGEGAVIGAGSVVSRDVPPGHIAVGNPARVVGEGSAVL